MDDLFRKTLLSTTERQFTLIIVRRLGACFGLGGLGFGCIGALGDGEACGEPRLEVAGELILCDR